MKKTYLVLASILSAAILNSSTSASAQSLFGGVPSVVRSCHKFSSRDWTAPDTASFLRSIACEDPNQDPKVDYHHGKAELGPAIKASLTAYHAKLRPAPDIGSSPAWHNLYPASPASPSSSSSSSPPSLESGDDFESGGFFVLTRYSDTVGGRDVRQSTDVSHAPTGTTTMDEDDNQLGDANTNARQDHTDIPDAHVPSLSPSPDANPINHDSQISPGRQRRTFVIGLNGLNPSPRPKPYRGIFSPNPHPNEATYVLAFNPRGHRPGPLPDGPCSVTKPCIPQDNSLCSTIRFIVSWLLWRPSIHPRPSDPLFKPIRDSSPNPYRWTTPPKPSPRTYYICLNGRRPGPSPSPSPSPSPIPTPTPSRSTSPSTSTSPSPNSHGTPSSAISSGMATTPQETTCNHFLGLGPKASLKVDDQLEGQLQSWTGKSMVWPASNGCIVFAKLLGMSSAIASSDDRKRMHSTVLLASRAGTLKRVLRARKALMQEGKSEAIAKDTEDSWGWLPWRRRNRQDVERARMQLGRVIITLDNRGRLEVLVDGTKVLSRSGPHKREWRNRLRWKRKKSNDYELHVVDHGVEVRLGERTIWGVTADHIMD